jgi:polysaccharide export outer membrane protein
MASKTASAIVGVGLALLAGGGLRAQQVEPRIAPSDQLTVTVFGVDSLSGKFLVDAAGEFEFPLVGRLKAGGLTARDLGSLISRSLVDKKIMAITPQVVVELLQTANHRVTVTGEVRVPQEIVFAGTLKLFDALVRVGMTGPDAGDQILVVRAPVENAEEEILHVNLRELSSGNLSDYDIDLQDGDRVIVPAAEKVFIDGYVRSPGAYVVPSGATVRQALTLAGGITDRGSDRGIRILRRIEGENDPKELKNVELSEPVQPGDTIIIRKRIL